MTLKSFAAATALSVLILQAPALATEAGDITREALYSGKFSDGIIALSPLAEAGDSEAVFGLGLIRFVRSLETVAFQLYTYGLRAPETGPMGPAVAVPVPINPDPSPLDYEKVRGVLGAMQFNFGTAEADFLKAGESGDWVMLVDPLRIRIDANGDGVAADSETIAGIFQIAAPQVPEQPAVEAPPADPPAQRNNRSQRPQNAPAASEPPAGPDTTIGFDRADAIWLAGYTNIILMQAEFFLAHDFSSTVNATFHRLFPQSGFPMQDYATGGTLMMDPQTDTAIADAIAAIHTINWPVTDPAMLKGVLDRAKQVIALSRRNWEAILAETDDRRELVPSPRQTSIVPEGQVTQEVVDAWHATLDTAEQVLDGELLIPHWRFQQGFDLRAYFETATHTDFVMLLTGYDAVPFLRDGPLATAESFAEANRVFGADFIGYVFWFN
jgi:hypothetical protein